jgi:hypothetical protein
MDRRVIAAAVVGVVALGGLTYLAHDAQSTAQAKNVAAQATVKKLRSDLLAQQNAAQAGAGKASAATLKSQVKTVLGQDVVWPAIVANIGVKLPPGVVLTSFAGTHALPDVVVPVAPAPGATSNVTGASGAVPAVPAAPVANPNDLCAGLVAPVGTVAMNGTAPDLSAVSALLDSLKSDTDLTVLWVTTAHVSGTTSRSVAFTITTSLGSTARGHRLETFFKEASCR